MSRFLLSSLLLYFSQTRSSSEITHLRPPIQKVHIQNEILKNTGETSLAFPVVNENHQAVSISKHIHTYCIYWYLKGKKKSPNSKGFFPLKFWNVQSEPKKPLRMRRSEKDSLSKLWQTNVPSLFTISFFLCINLLFTNDCQNPARYLIFSNSLN